MKVKVKVSGAKGEAVEVLRDVQQGGELASIISGAIDDYRLGNPDAEAFDCDVKVSHA